MYKLKLLVATMLCFLISGCSFYPVTGMQKTSPRHKFVQASQSKRFFDWDAKFKVRNQHKSIQLLAHQKYPIFYLEMHPAQTGLVLNHDRGTGKTFTAIEFAERHPEHPVIIIAPKFLHSHWLEHLNQYQVKDQTRYRFFDYEHCKSLLEEKVSNAILIIDDSHRLIEKVRFDIEHSNVYGQLYLHLRTAWKILSLSATPLYTDSFDLAYQVNLVAGKDILPFNQSEFEKQCFMVDPWRAYWRGHLVTSNYFINPFLSGALGLYVGGWIKTYVPNWLEFSVEGLGTFLGLLSSSNVSPIAERYIPLTYYTVKKFNLENFSEILNRYFSYYSFEHDMRFYPKELSFSKKLYYNLEQLNFMYKFYDSQLSAIQFKQIIKDTTQVSQSFKAQLALNNSKMQNAYKKQAGAGREIGNLPLINRAKIQAKDLHRIRNKLSMHYQPEATYSSKFEAILSRIKKSNGPVVIYSHYYYNGILLFKQFLDAQGYQGQYELLHPDMPIAQHKKIVEGFNANQFKVLLLHPDITEGISLKGTRQLHFLDRPINQSLERQVIGRAIRYHSHTNLPLSEQKVSVYFWYYVIPKLQSYTMQRRNWHANFAELNYYSLLGDVNLVDENHALKLESPDVRAHRKSKELYQITKLFSKHLKEFSIENSADFPKS